MSKKDDTTQGSTGDSSASWAGAAAIAGAAIGSAAVAAALLFASRRNERNKLKPPVLPSLPPETD